MFTGIISNTAAIKDVQERGSGRSVRIDKPQRWKLRVGQSISIDGICSTVTNISKSYFEVEYMPETLRKTTVSTFAIGRRVNLERSLTLKDAVDGHLVQGHIDAVGKIAKIEKEGDSALYTVTIAEFLEKYVALHGSISLNGVSLTVARKRRGTFTVALIPLTLQHTNLGLSRVGSLVNIEVDLLARYAVAALEQRGRVSRNEKKRPR